MTGKSGFRVVVFCVASAALAVAAQQAAVTPPTAASGTTRDVAERRSLGELRKDLRKAEERFNALYNKLNQDRDQRLVCEDSASAGSRLVKRSCNTESARAAAAQDAIDYMAAANLGSALAAQGGNGSSIPVDAAAAASATGIAVTDNQAAVARTSPDVDARRKAYGRNLEKLLAEHADLRQALNEFVAARQRYDAAERK